MKDLLHADHIALLKELAQHSDNVAIQRRARLLLLYHDGQDTRTVSEQVGLSPDQVRYWRRQYQVKGLEIFPEEVLAEETVSVGGGMAARFAAEASANGNGNGSAPYVTDYGWKAVAALAEDGEVDLDDPALYINRELSLLEFQRRVLEEALDPSNPLLERVKFLSIVGSNLDEFFMVRVGGVKKQIAAGVADPSPDGLSPAEQLAAIRTVAHDLLTQAHQYFNHTLLQELADNGIMIYHYADLTEKQQGQLKEYFDDVIFPVLTPLAFDPGHPFPHISNLSLNLAVMIRDDQGREHFARVKVPGTIPRLVPVKKSSGGLRKDGTAPTKHYFVWVEQLIAANLNLLFPGMEIVEAHPFRVTRNADMVIQELEADDLLETMEESVRQRRFGAVVRVSINPEMSPSIRQILYENLNLDRNDIYVLEGPLGLNSLMSLYGSIERYDLRDVPFVPYTQPALRRELRDSDLFGEIRKSNFIIQHPYDSFSPVVDFLDKAATDPNVLAIKQTLYRVGRNSPVVKALLKARQHGKQVAVLVELKARFDEESNIEWAKLLEQEGVHVIYGLLGLKTHSKIALVIRKEGDHIRRYVHLATGNYNAVTAHLYEDLGYFTADKDIGADATDLFNYLTGYSDKRDYRKLLVAPINLRARIEELIDREMQHQQEGRQGHLIFKTNSLIDKAIIRQLYEASCAGVKVDLIVRGICGLRPGIPGISENINVISVLGRFLEHSRIYYFRNGGDEQIYLGSADLMQRNLNRRVEILFPVEEKQFVRYLREDILYMYLTDNVKARKMQPDGSYVRVHPAAGEPPINVQEWFLNDRLRRTQEDRSIREG